MRSRFVRYDRVAERGFAGDRAGDDDIAAPVDRHAMAVVIPGPARRAHPA